MSYFNLEENEEKSPASPEAPAMLLCVETEGRGKGSEDANESEHIETKRW
jgi:hypothetical protein